MKAHQLVCILRIVKKVTISKLHKCAITIRHRPKLLFQCFDNQPCLHLTLLLALHHTSVHISLKSRKKTTEEVLTDALKKRNLEGLIQRSRHNQTLYRPLIQQIQLQLLNLHFIIILSNSFNPSNSYQTQSIPESHLHPRFKCSFLPNECVRESGANISFEIRCTIQVSHGWARNRRKRCRRIAKSSRPIIISIDYKVKRLFENRSSHSSKIWIRNGLLGAIVLGVCPIYDVIRGGVIVLFERLMWTGKLASIGWSWRHSNEFGCWIDI